MCNKLKCPVIFLNSVSFSIYVYNLPLGCLYNSQSSIMCYTVSATPHQWQDKSSLGISFLIQRVSLLPSHPILSLKMYLIWSIMYLLSLIYLSFIFVFVLSQFPEDFKSGEFFIYYCSLFCTSDCIKIYCFFDNFPSPFVVVFAVLANQSKVRNIHFIQQLLSVIYCLRLEFYCFPEDSVVHCMFLEDQFSNHVKRVSDVQCRNLLYPQLHLSRFIRTIYRRSQNCPDSSPVSDVIFFLYLVILSQWGVNQTILGLGLHSSYNQVLAHSRSYASTT